MQIGARQHGGNTAFLCDGSNQVIWYNIELIILLLFFWCVCVLSCLASVWLLQSYEILSTFRSNISKMTFNWTLFSSSPSYCCCLHFSLLDLFIFWIILSFIVKYMCFVHICTVNNNSICVQVWQKECNLNQNCYFVKNGMQFLMYSQ